MHRLANRAIVALALVALLAVGCGTAATPPLAPTWTPQPTYTPYPTPAPALPTVTPDRWAGVPERRQYLHDYRITEEYDKFKELTFVTLEQSTDLIRTMPSVFSVVYSYS